MVHCVNMSEIMNRLQIVISQDLTGKHRGQSILKPEKALQTHKKHIEHHIRIALKDRRKS